MQHSIEIIEIGVALETDPELAHWAWYSGAYHQYHSILFPLVQVCMHPDLELADRIMAVADHVFGPSSPESGVQQRAVTILRAVKDNLASFLDVVNVPKQEPPPDPLYQSPMPMFQHQAQHMQHFIPVFPSQHLAERTRASVAESHSTPSPPTEAQRHPAAGVFGSHIPGYAMGSRPKRPSHHGSSLSLLSSDDGSGGGAGRSFVGYGGEGLPEASEGNVWWPWPPPELVPEPYDGQEPMGMDQQPWFG